MAACARELARLPRERWPEILLLIGDQVYADETGPATRRFIEPRRDPSVPPGYEVADFEEYCALYREAWSEPAVRWLLSVLPTIMIFDDHDVHDDWNSSAAWRREYEAKPWWRSRITGAYMSYWLYQHLGNLSPAELGKDEVWRQIQEAGDGTDVLAELAAARDRGAGGIRWSVRRDFGTVRVVVIDSRSRRVIGDDRRRRMVDEAEWEWVTESVSGDWDHLVLATSLPLLLPHGIHDLEAWNEAVCAGAWGSRAARAGERLRQAVDLEHWAAFGKSFADFERLLTGLATGAYGRAPASVTVIGGDVHHSYLAPVDFPAGTSPRSAVYQAVCSPMHNVLPDPFRLGLVSLGARAVLMKGGHLEGDKVVDLLVHDGVVDRFEDARIPSRNTHGTGCTLASATAAGLAQNMSLRDAVARARRYVRAAIEQAPGFGAGHGPLNHAVTVRSGTLGLSRAGLHSCSSPDRGRGRVRGARPLIPLT